MRFKSISLSGFPVIFPCGNIVFLSRTFFWIYNSIFIHPFIVLTAPLAGDSVRMCAMFPSLIAGYLRLAQCQTCSIHSRMWWRNGYNNALIKIIRLKLPAGNWCCDSKYKCILALLCYLYFQVTLMRTQYLELSITDSICLSEKLTKLQRVSPEVRDAISPPAPSSHTPTFTLISCL